MLIDLISDLHLEHPTNVLPKPQSNICFFAGDLSHGETFSENIFELAENYDQIFLVTGNHDYYNSSNEEIDDWLANESPENIIVLKPGVVTKLGKYHIIGCTLWFESHPLASSHKQWLEEKADKNTIILTHYLPSHQSIAPPLRDHPKNFAYVNNCEELIKKRQPAFWFHGHTHEPGQYSIGQTKIYCHPRGYPHERNNYQALNINI